MSRGYAKNKRVFLLLPILLAVTAIAFQPALRNGFVNFDDMVLLTGNPLVKQLSIEGLKNIFSTFLHGAYTPLPVFTYAVEFYFFETNPFVYHLTNLLLHLGCMALVFWLFYRLTRDLLTAFFTALLFGVHPLRVESVAWISERKDVLYGFFYLASIVSFLYYRKLLSRKYYLLSFLFFLLSVLSKPMAVTLPLALLLFDAFHSKKIGSCCLVEMIPFFSVSVVFSVVAAVSQFPDPAAYAASGPASPGGIFVTAYTFVFYLLKLLFPFNLSCVYPSQLSYKSDLSTVFLLSPFLLVFLGLLVFLTARNSRNILLGLSFYVLTLLPVSQLIPQDTPALVANRYSYIPAIGLFFIASAGLARLFAGRAETSLRLVSRALIVLVLGVFIFQTRSRCGVWRDSLTLWQDAFKKYPSAQITLTGLAEAHVLQNNYPSAVMVYSRVLALYPGHSETLNSRAGAYAVMGEYEKALADLDLAIRMDPAGAHFYLNRGLIYLKQGEHDQAIEDFSRAIHLKTDFDSAYLNRSQAYFKKNDLQSALRDITRAIACNPSNGYAYNIRAYYYFKMQQIVPARRDAAAAAGLGYKMDPRLLKALEPAPDSGAG